MSVSRVRIADRVEEFFRDAPPGRWRLLALTYWFDSKAFETRFGRLLGKAIRVDVDVVVGKDLDGLTRGADYRTWRASWPGTFHPKVLIMLANDRIEVGVGS